MDLLQLFNMLTGFSKQTEYKKLLVAPHNLREGIIERIYREIDAHKAGRPAKIQFKLNSLVDPEVIDALYDASEAGVEVDLIVRGICCLQPGIPSQSETIRVVSIVGRFLEHSRVYTFQNGGKPEAFIGSADLMRRNLDRRVEVLAPVSDGNHIKQLSAIIDLCMRDNQNAWKLLPDGKYERILPGKNEASFCAQSYLIKHPMGLKK
jgi:polyphosphate kinase